LLGKRELAKRSWLIATSNLFIGVTVRNILVVLIACAALLSLICFIATAASLRKKELLSSVFRFLLALFVLSLTGLFGMIVIATAGYRALTHEEIAAVVKTEPTGEKGFTAHFLFSDGHKESYKLVGDALYVDAHILKWKPIVNIFGLHTAYELDRVAGRYMDLKEERESIRTVFLLSRDKPVNLFNLRQRYSLFRPLLDAEYGSASFINADNPAYFEIRVSTTGLLIRKVGREEVPQQIR
jgi:energy-coupling factor transporter transmembrane protein EcfT